MQCHMTWLLTLVWEYIHVHLVYCTGHWWRAHCVACGVMSSQTEIQVNNVMDWFSFLRVCCCSQSCLSIISELVAIKAVVRKHIICVAWHHLLLQCKSLNTVSVMCGCVECMHNQLTPIPWAVWLSLSADWENQHCYQSENCTSSYSNESICMTTWYYVNLCPNTGKYSGVG